MHRMADELKTSRRREHRWKLILWSPKNTKEEERKETIEQIQDGQRNHIPKPLARTTKDLRIHTFKSPQTSQGATKHKVKIAKKSPKWSKKSQITKFPSLEHQNLHFSLKTKPEHPKYDRIFMPSRRPKVMILIWKDRYLSHDPRRSGKRSFGSLVGPELIFYQDMSDERLSRAHGDFDGSRGPRYRAQGLGSS
ncbi:unnamed protein product [Microthlaspi erraticum]|uniref:Uncharacterized protein n=1 Tax=Microthlaspi erraticum TaxID=1685480 RepID=A0A6D2JBI5_9BRAS|nr:unnamed protein product [Microthlaspi erraticum]